MLNGQVKLVTDTTAFAKKISGAGHNKEDIEAITKFILEEIVNQK
jgi:hypothetical protein